MIVRVQDALPRAEPTPPRKEHPSWILDAVSSEVHPLSLGGGPALSTVESRIEPVSTGPPPVYAVAADREFCRMNQGFIWPDEICFITVDDIRMDMLGEELGTDSNVWVAYVSTAVTHDTHMIDGWNKSLDVLLIFVCH
jgi:hypothetical protein